MEGGLRAAGLLRPPGPGQASSRLPATLMVPPCEARMRIGSRAEWSVAGRRAETLRRAAAAACANRQPLREARIPCAPGRGTGDRGFASGQRDLTLRSTVAEGARLAAGSGGAGAPPLPRGEARLW